MTVRNLALSLISLTLFSCANAEQVEINFNYNGNERSTFSNLKGSLSIDAFSDERQVEDQTLITTESFGGDSDGYFAETEIAKIMQTAFQQGFERNGASLVDSDSDFTISGSILAIDATTIDRAGVETIQITFRTKLELKTQGRVAWQTTLFGRGRAAVEEGIVPAVRQAIERTIGELIADDYFKMEII